MRPGEPVKLLVSYYAGAVTGPGRTPRGTSRFVLSNERLKLVMRRTDKPGGAVIEDASGRRYYCPLDYLAEAQ